MKLDKKRKILLGLLIILGLTIVLFFYFKDKVIAVILYTSDLKGFYLPSQIQYSEDGVLKTKDYFGVLGISQFVNKQRKKYGEDKVILVDAGDAFWGSFESRYLQERGDKYEYNISDKKTVLAEFMNEIGYDAYCIGNLDFDFGLEALLDIQSKLSHQGNYIDRTKHSDPHAFKLLSLNTKFLKNAKNPFGEFLFINLKDASVKVVGLITNESKNLVPKKLLRRIDISDEVASLTGILMNESFPNYNNKTNINVVLAHSEKIYSIAKAVSYNSSAEINIVIPSHLIAGFKDRKKLINGIYIAPYVFTAPSNSEGGNIGKIIISRNIFTGKVSLKFDVVFIEEISNCLNSNIEHEIKKYNSITENIGDKVIPTDLKQRCDALGKTNSLTEETMMGHLVTDAIRSVTSSDISIINALAIRNGFYNKNITIRELYKSLPFEDELVVVKLMGKQIKGLLYQNKYSFFNYLHFSGMKIKVTYDKQGVPRDNIFYNNRPIQDDSLYKVGITDFLLNGGDNILINDKTIKEVCYHNTIVAENKSAREALLIYLYDNKVYVDAKERMSFDGESKRFKDIIKYIKTSDYFFDQEQVSNAFVLLMKAYYINPNDQLIKSRLAISLAKYFSLFYQGYYDEELEDYFEKIIKTDFVTDKFDKSEKYFRLSESFLLQLLNLSAKEDIDLEMIEKSITESELWLLLGGNYLEHGDYLEAKKIFESLILMERKLSENQRAQLYTYIGVIRYQDYMRTGEMRYLNDSEVYLCNSLQINNRLDYLNHSYLGFTYYKLNKFTEAKHHIEMAFRINPTDPLKTKSLLITIDNELSN